MKYYEQLLKMGCFSWDELCAIVGNKKSADSIVRNYSRKGYIQSVKRNLYIAVDLATGESVVNKFRIAGKITPTSYVSHHAAFALRNYLRFVAEIRADTEIAPAL